MSLSEGSPPLRRPVPRFFFIRHGETDWNRDGRLQGQHDIPLNPLGRDQAAASGRSLGKLLATLALRPENLRFVASPLSRTQDTMRRVRGAMRLDPDHYLLDPCLKELSFGAWEGRTWPEVKALSPDLLRARKRDKWGFVSPEGESYAMLCERLRPWLAAVEPDQVVVSHGGVARVLMRLVANVSTEQAPNLDVWQGRVLIFEAHRFAWL